MARGAEAFSCTKDGGDLGPWNDVGNEISVDPVDDACIHVSQGGRVQVHVGDGAGDQLTSDPDPLLSHC